MCNDSMFDGVDVDPELSFEEKVRVAVWAKALCEFNGIEPATLINAGFSRGLFTSLKNPNLDFSFTQADLKKIAEVICVAAESLLSKGEPTEEAMEAALTAFEEGHGNEETTT